ncbi:MAG: twin-arginine translocase TatA/TatE family subunit [Opitutales bacterium]
MAYEAFTTLAMWTPGIWEVVIILAVVLLIFGPKKLPELARGVAKSIKEFKKASSEVEENIRDGLNEAERAAAEENRRKAELAQPAPESTATPRAESAEKQPATRTDA